ncbi:MAG: ferredoxin [Halobacteriales archaeon]
MAPLRVEFDRDVCIGMFNCVHEHDAFEEDADAGKADLAGADEVGDGTFVLTVADEEAFEAKMAARVCPVDAIAVYDEDGEQLVP